MERKQDPVDEKLLEPRVNVARAQRADDLVNRLHHHAAVRLALIFEVLHHTADDLRAPDLVRELNSGLDQGLVVSPAWEKCRWEGV